jgi:hypothetical protein
VTARKHVTPERRLRAQAAAYARWSTVPLKERKAATAKARDGLQARFEREVDPTGTMTGFERAVLVEARRRAYFAAIASKSLASRRKNRGAA